MLPGGGVPGITADATAAAHATVLVLEEISVLGYLIWRNLLVTGDLHFLSTMNLALKGYKITLKGPRKKIVRNMVKKIVKNKRYVSYIATVLNYRYISSYVMLDTHSIQGYFSAPIQHSNFFARFLLACAFLIVMGGRENNSIRREKGREGQCCTFAAR